MKKLILSLSLLMALSNSSLYCMNGDKAPLDQETRIEKLRKEVEELTLMKKLNKLKNEEKAESQTCGQLAKNGITTSIGACFVAGSLYKQANVVYQEALNKESLLNIVSGEKAFGAVNWIKENPGMFTACTISTILVGTLIQKGMKQRVTKPTPTASVFPYPYLTSQVKISIASLRFNK